MFKSVKNVSVLKGVRGYIKKACKRGCRACIKGINKRLCGHCVKVALKKSLQSVDKRDKGIRA